MVLLFTGDSAQLAALLGQQGQAGFPNLQSLGPGLPPGFQVLSVPPGPVGLAGEAATELSSARSGLNSRPHTPELGLRMEDGATSQVRHTAALIDARSDLRGTCTVVACTMIQ